MIFLGHNRRPNYLYEYCGNYWKNIKIGGKYKNVSVKFHFLH